MSNLKVLGLSSVAALTGLLACTAPAADSVGSSDQNATADIHHMIRRADGKFDVWCADGKVETGLTAEEINMNLACGGPTPGSSTSSSGFSSTSSSSGSVEPTTCLNTNPIDHTQFPYVKANAKAPGSCTAQELTALGAYYKAHVSEATFNMTAWKTSVSATCGACIFTDNPEFAPAQTWGPLLTRDDQLEVVNRGGCVEQVSGSEACGRSYQQYQDCLIQACLIDCKTQQDFTACRSDQRVLTTSCKGALEAVQTNCGTQVTQYETACKGTTYTFEGPIKVACINP